MQSCGYNQSPSWVTQNMFNNLEASSSSNVAYSINGRSQEQPAGKPDCSCSIENPPYKIEKCNYNQSPTWKDQAPFRQDILNKY